MTNNSTGAAAASGAMNLDDILGKAPEAEPLEEEVKVEEEAEEGATKEPEAKEEEPEKRVLVPHGAFHEERERRKELQKKVSEQEEAYRKLEERQNKILEALAKPAQQEPEYVDPLQQLQDDVRGVKDTIQKTQKQIDEDHKRIQDQTQLVSRYKGSIDAYVKDAPDFMEARSYLIADKIKELQALDYTPAEIEAEILTIEKGIVERSYKQEKNPAEVIHKLAKEKGYKPKEQDKKIEDIDKGLKASKTLGGGGKVAGSEENLSSLSAEDLRDMSDDEFNALFTKLKKQSKRA